MKPLGLLAAFLMGGCFTPPVGIQHAERALVMAESEGAAEYLPAEYAAVKAKIEGFFPDAVRQYSSQSHSSPSRRAYCSTSSANTPRVTSTPRGPQKFCEKPATP